MKKHKQEPRIAVIWEPGEPDEEALRQAFRMLLGTERRDQDKYSRWRRQFDKIRRSARLKKQH
jgi:hypothetical protein